uniref:Uncharacterized protein n=1 Tax=Mustela putorius furo TaxID=9669 RepID=M3YG29_MUSPF
MAGAGHSGHTASARPRPPPLGPRSHLRAWAEPGSLPGPKPRCAGRKVAAAWTGRTPAPSAAGRGPARRAKRRVPAGLTWLRGGRAHSEQQDQRGEHVQEAPRPRPQPRPPAGDRPQTPGARRKESRWFPLPAGLAASHDKQPALSFLGDRTQTAMQSPLRPLLLSPAMSQDDHSGQNPPELCFGPRVTRTRPKSRADALLAPRPEQATTGSALGLPRLPLPSALLRAQVHPDQQPGNPGTPPGPTFPWSPDPCRSCFSFPGRCFGCWLVPFPLRSGEFGPRGQPLHFAPPAQKEAGKERRRHVKAGTGVSRCSSPGTPALCLG